MHYVTCISQQMQKHRFGVTCPGALFVESEPVPPEHENRAIMFHASDALEWTT
jgi:hypothetical protein